MPSWNIHTAHVERLLREHGASELGIGDKDAFLMGNLLPDVYVGYMVPDASWRIDYKLTHLTMRDHIPLPRYQEFWDFYVERPEDYGAHCVTDVVRGAWCHLVCDHVYNATPAPTSRSSALPQGRRPASRSRPTSPSWQDLNIEMVPAVTNEVLGQCRSFPQYSVVEKDVRAASSVAASIVEKNRLERGRYPDYQLLTANFFDTARNEADQIMVKGLSGSWPLDREQGSVVWPIV